MEIQVYLLNAFSLNMIPVFPAVFAVNETTLEQARKIARGCKSAIGHADTAAVFSAVLGLPVAAERVNVILRPGDMALIGQYRGPRLPEGATSLPEGATIQWLLVAIILGCTKITV